MTLTDDCAVHVPSRFLFLKNKILSRLSPEKMARTRADVIMFYIYMFMRTPFVGAHFNNLRRLLVRTVTISHF